ncbi:MAG: hypothetical protein ACLU4J_15085 [Butyricimonas paravirosa]
MLIPLCRINLASWTIGIVRTYGSITQSSANNTNYSARGQLVFGYFNSIRNLQVLAGAEMRGSKTKVFTKNAMVMILLPEILLPAPERQMIRLTIINWWIWRIC